MYPGTQPLGIQKMATFEYQNCKKSRKPFVPSQRTLDIMAMKFDRVVVSSASTIDKLLEVATTAVRKGDKLTYVLEIGEQFIVLSPQFSPFSKFVLTARAVQLFAGFEIVALEDFLGPLGVGCCAWDSEE